MDTYHQWREELGSDGRWLQIEDGKITIKHAIFPPHFQVAELFKWTVGLQIPDYDPYCPVIPPKTSWTLREFSPDESLYYNDRPEQKAKHLLENPFGIGPFLVL